MTRTNIIENLALVGAVIAQAGCVLPVRVRFEVFIVVSMLNFLTCSFVMIRRACRR